MEVNSGGQTVSATRFAELTGVARERLRAWERRYGFPEPVRIAGGPRRYRAEDVPRVVAVRLAAAEGTPIAVAIERMGEAPGEAAIPDALAATVEQVPFPVVLVSGPEPLRVEWTNGALRDIAGAPRAGDALPPQLRESRIGELLRRQFTSDDLPRLECQHPDWGTGGSAVRSAVFRLPAAAGARPLVAVVDLETRHERDARRELAAAEAELELLRRRNARHERWLDAYAALAIAFQREPGPEVVDVALDVLVRQTQAVDAALATVGGGRLAVAASQRGLLRGGELVVAGHPAIARALRDGEGLWLDLAAARSVGVPEALAASAIPVVVAGEVLGMVLMVFEHVEPHDDDNRRLLASVSAAVGFAVLRDRLVRELRTTSGQASGRFERAD